MKNTNPCRPLFQNLDFQSRASLKFFFLGMSAIGAIGSARMGQEAHAADLKTPFSIENAQTLPRRVGNPRLIQVWTSASQKFGGGGQTEALGQALNKQVSWGDVLASQDTDEKKNALRGVLGLDTLKNSSSPGSTTGQVLTSAQVRVAALAYGITERLTLGLVVPIVRVDVSADTGFVANADGQTFIQEVAQAKTPRFAQDATDRLNDAVNQKLSRLGYEEIPSEQTLSGIGDVQWVTKFKAYEDFDQTFALKSTLIFPTGEGPNVNKALDIPLGDDRFGIGSSLIYDRKLPGDFRVNTTLTYTALLPRQIDRRIPTSAEDLLAPASDIERLEENLRSQASWSLGLDRNFSTIGLTLGSGYALQGMTAVSYDEGTRFSSERYSLLRNTSPSQLMHSFLLTAQFSTVDWFKQKKFFYPLQLGFSYTHPFAGRNIAKSDLFVGELVLFF